MVTPKFKQIHHIVLNMCIFWISSQIQVPVKKLKLHMQNAILFSVDELVNRNSGGVSHGVRSRGTLRKDTQCLSRL